MEVTTAAPIIFLKGFPLTDVLYMKLLLSQGTCVISEQQNAILCIINKYNSGVAQLEVKGPRDFTVLMTTP